MNFVGPDYFAVHGVPLVLGREFAPGDHFGSPRVVVINEAMAALHWPGQNPIGKRLNFGDYVPKLRGLDEPWAEIIGIVKNVRHGGIDVPTRAYVYRAAMQYPRQEFEVMLRTSGAPDALASAARDAVNDFDPTLPMFATRTLGDVVQDASADVRHGSRLLASLAAMTVMLAGVGIFSVLAYVVAARRRDLAIRVALGATSTALAGSVMRHALSMLAPGIVVGVAGAFAAAGSLKALLYEVEPTDTAVFVGATLAVVAVAFLAAYVPARRAARVDPVSALKSE
jgi:putative ABC transport system permease protein